MVLLSCLLRHHRRSLLNLVKGFGFQFPLFNAFFFEIWVFIHFLSVLRLIYIPLSFPNKLLIQSSQHGLSEVIIVNFLRIHCLIKHLQGFILQLLFLRKNQTGKNQSERIKFKTLQLLKLAFIHSLALFLSCDDWDVDPHQIVLESFFKLTKMNHHLCLLYQLLYIRVR